MEENCQKCFERCNAHCCTFVSLPVKFILDNTDKFKRKIIKLIPEETLPGYAYAISSVETKIVNGKIQYHIDRDKQLCPFLTKDKKCAVYDKRPYICKQYGTRTEKYHFLTCQCQITDSNHSGFDDINEQQLLVQYSSTIYRTEFEHHLLQLMLDAQK